MDVRRATEIFEEVLKSWRMAQLAIEGTTKTDYNAEEIESDGNDYRMQFLEALGEGNITTGYETKRENFANDLKMIMVKHGVSMIMTGEQGAIYNDSSDGYFDYDEALITFEVSKSDQTAK